jgi:signal transduction histidine kinase
MKIRLRLTIWYFIITFLILIVFSGVIFYVMRGLVFGAMDKDLGIVADSIEKSYDADLNMFYDFKADEHEIDHFLEFYLVVYDTASTIVYKSLMANVMPLNIPLPKDHMLQKNIFETHPKEKLPFIRPDKDNEVTLRIITRQMFYQDRSIGWITVGMTMNRIQRSMEKLLQALLIGLFGALILLAIGGYFLTGRALNPVYIITKKANQISHSNLKERIEIRNKNDEMGQLSITLNNLFERLQQSFESQQQFLSDAAHELKTPLAILRAHWEGELNNPHVSIETKEKMVHDIETITRLNHLINNLLLLSKTEVIQFSFERSPLRLDEILKGVIEDATVLAESKSQDIQVVELSDVMVQGDKMRLYQLFFNLMDNAMKYSPEESTIWISLHKEDSWAVVQVRDNGLGIAPEDLPHVFERFYRVEKDRARKTGGSGLGLSICKLITELHRGTIEVESIVGNGTIFTINLPIYDMKGQTTT